MTETNRCIKCGWGACICSDVGGWAAHCMNCDHAVGKPQFYDPCCETEEEAIKQWNEINPIA